MFAGFRSRWMMPCSCAASSASAICFAIGSASSSGIGRRAIRSASVVALDEFHHERGGTAAFFEPIDGSNVRMIQRGEDFRFALEASQSVGICRAPMVGRILMRDFTLQLRVDGPIHLPHAAFADVGSYLVHAEASSGAESQSCWRELYERNGGADRITPA